MTKKRYTEYVEGYDHYDKKRTIQIILKLNEAENNFLDDLLAVRNIRNKSDFIRKQVFHFYQNLTDEEKKKMAEMAKWRATEDNNTPAKEGNRRNKNKR